MRSVKLNEALSEFNKVHGDVSIFKIVYSIGSTFKEPIIIIEADDKTNYYEYDEILSLKPLLDELNGKTSDRAEVLNSIRSKLGRGHYVYYYTMQDRYTICDFRKVTILS